MKKLPQTKRLEYWKYQCAALTFLRAKDVGEYLIEHKTSPLAYQLLTALYVLYGRPFKQRKQVRIPEQLVPSEYAEEHSLLLDLRDKMFAHVDTNGPSEKNIESLTKILMRVENGAASTGMASLLPNGFQFERTRDLCDYLREACDKESEGILLDAMDRSCPAPNLTYEIDLGPGDAYLIKPWKR